MLAFDIETTGLSPAHAVVTCVCAEDFRSGKRYSFEYARIKKQSPEQLADMNTALVCLFEEASSLCAFNGIRFDLPFMETALGIDPETIKRWKKKTSDILEKCREEYKHTFKLDLLCQCNDIVTKSSSGLQAIQWAKEGKWEDLRSYCEFDVHILCELYRKRHLINPRNQKIMDLRNWSHADVYKCEDTQDSDCMEVIEVYESCESCNSDGSGASGASDVPDVSDSEASIALRSIARRVGRLSCVHVTQEDIFGVDSKFVLVTCPVCEEEGFIQQDTQNMGTDMNNVKNVIFACGMQHAYRIQLPERLK